MNVFETWKHDLDKYLGKVILIYSYYTCLITKPGTKLMNGVLAKNESDAKMIDYVLEVLNICLVRILLEMVD